MPPADTTRLHFREMVPADLNAIADLLGNPEVMRFYPAPKTRDQARAWIDWNSRNYREYGHGLWVIETPTGEFVGDCGLTLQNVNGTPRLEVGYHVHPRYQRRGLATEAAAACRDFARDRLRAPELIAIIHPDNQASLRVAKNIGMHEEEEPRRSAGTVHAVFSMSLDGRPSTGETPSSD